MKIRKVSIWQFSRRLDGKAWNPAFRWKERCAPLIVVETECGARGIGEAWSGYGKIEPVLRTLAREVAPALIGRSFSSPESIHAEIFPHYAAAASREQAAAWSGVDIAIWDAMARTKGVPVWQLLNGASALARVYASGGLYRDDYSLDQLSAEFRGYKEAGFTSMKMKVCGLSVEEDVKRVQTVREALGDEPWLWIDAVNQLTVESALEFWTRLAPFQVSGLQSPLSARDVLGLSALHAFGLPTIASEAEYKLTAFEHLLDAKAVLHLQFCLPLCGGFSGGAVLNERAAWAGISTTPQCFSTAIAQAATLNFAAGQPNVHSAEFHCYHDHLKDLFEKDVGTVSQGFATAGCDAGLGVRIPDVGVQGDGSVISVYSEVR